MARTVLQFVVDHELCLTAHVKVDYVRSKLATNYVWFESMTNIKTFTNIVNF